MRPVRRGGSPQAHDFATYKDALPFLVSRIGSYCSYCERRIVANLAVEHIQPKTLHPALIGRWDNFLLGCVNCNSTKGDKDVILAEIFLPDRDNTFVAFIYTQDGKVAPAPDLTQAQRVIAARTLALVGLDKKIVEALDENGHAVAVDRVAQRMETWLLADDTRSEVKTHPGNAVRRLAVELAKASGFFSIWMAVFHDDADMRCRLIKAFEGTEASECFDGATGAARTPAPNPDGLLDGGKR